MTKSIALRSAAICALVALLTVLLSATPALAQGGVSGDENVDLIETPPAGGQHIGWAPFQGAPTIPTNTLGIWVWNENSGGQNHLHIRTGNNGIAHNFTGTVTTGGASNFYNLAVFNGSGDDSVTTVAYNQFTFSIANTNGGEGVDVDWSGRWLSFDLFVDGSHAPAQVFYGSAGTATAGAPLIVVAGNRGLLTLSITLLDGPTSFHKNIADGYFLYRDAQGRFHMRMTTTAPSDHVIYRGGIIADKGQFGAIRFFHGDPRDSYRLIGDHRLEFKFFTAGYLDGLDWTLPRDNTGVTFTLKMDRQPAAPSVSLGSNPFGTLKALTFRLVP